MPLSTRDVRTADGSAKTGRFAIICLPRTGSTLLVELLDSHPEILCHTELFNPKSTYLSRKPHLDIGSKEQRDAHPWEFLNRVYSVTDGPRTIGFKIMPRHKERVLAWLLLNRSIRKIVLTRESWVDAYVSGLIASQTRNWFERQDEAAKRERDLPRVHVDVGRLRSHLRKVDLFFTGIRVLEACTVQRFLWVDYSSLNDQSTHHRLLQFLDVSSDVQLAADLRRQNARPLRDKISNYEEIESFLMQTGRLRRPTSTP